MRKIKPEKPSTNLKVKRVTKCYMVDPSLNDRLRGYAIENGYPLCECVDVAFEEFLEKRFVK